VAIKYVRGTIIKARVYDQNNANPKVQSVVLIRDFADTDTHAFGVAVTGTFTCPLPATSVLLPFNALVMGGVSLA
jgi:hypothetical protein